MATLENLQLNIANFDRIAGFGGVEPIEAIAKLGDVGEEIAFDDFFDGGDIGVFVED